MNGIWISFIGGLALGGMQLSWLALAVLVLNRRIADDSLPWVAILLFYPVAAALNLLLRTRIGEWKRLSLVNGLGGLLAFGLYLGFRFLTAPAAESGSWAAAAFDFLNPYRTEFLVFSFSAVAWALGCRLAVRKISFPVLFGEFQFGLIFLFFFLFAEHRLEMSLPHLVPLILLFFSSALLGIGITHGRERAGWTSERFFRTWILFLFVAVALILVAGLLITVLASPGFVQFLFSLLYRAGEFLLGILGRILKFLAGLLPLPDPSLPIPPPASPPPPKPEDWSPFLFISDTTREILRVLWTLMVSSLLLVALWRISTQILDWLRRRMGALNGEEIEPLPGAFRADLRLLLLWLLDALSLRWLLRFLGRRKRGRPEDDSLRHSYIRLLRWAAARGCRRRISQTPFDFLPHLIQFLPEAGEDFALITRQYVRARYGPSPPPGEAFAEVKAHWEIIQRIGQRERKKIKKKSGEEFHERNES